MSQFVDEKTQEILNKWSRKLGVSVDALAEKLVDIAEQSVKPLYPDKSEIFYEVRARSILGSRLASLLRIRAEPFQCYFFGCTEKRDINAREIERKRTLFETDRERALIDGETDSKGTPLDTRKTIGGRPNPRFGKPLLPFYQKIAIGIAKKYGTAKIKILWLTLRGEQADLEVPLEKPVIGRINLRTDHPFRYIATSSRVTSFEPVDFREVEGKSAVDLLREAPSDLKVSVFDLADWHEEHQQDPFRLAIVEGDVLFKRNEPTSTGNYILTIGDVEEDIEFEGITVFVPSTCKDKLDFGVGSKVIVTGQTRLGIDLLTGERDRITINAFSLHVIPEYRVVPQVESIFLPEPSKAIRE